MKKQHVLLTFWGMLMFSNLPAQSYHEICDSSLTDGTVVDFEYVGDTLYATGFFQSICGKSVGYLARWDSGEWHPAPVQLSDPGHALTEINDQLFIARYEQSIDSNWVYVMEDSSLNTLGKGVYLTSASGLSNLPNIYDIVEYDGKIMACGEFDRVGSELIRGIMQWNGSKWEAVGSGLSGNISGSAPVMFPHQMMVHDSALYVVGNFRIAGNTLANGVAKWDGTKWSRMGDGFNQTVYSIAVFRGEIIAGGSFTESDGIPINRIAKWNGTKWQAMDFGFTATSPNDFIFVHTLKVIDDVLIIAGGLKQLTYPDQSTEICNGIVAYDGYTINTFQGGVMNNDIEAIVKVDSQHLLIGGGVSGSGYTGISDIPTHIEEEEFNPEVIIYPNPFEAYIHLDTDHRFREYQLMDLTGRVVQKGLFEEELQLDVSPGTYVLVLMEGHQISRHILVKR